MSVSLFAPDVKQQVRQAVQPVHPPLSAVPPDGPPVPVLASQGWLGSIGQFAARVNAVTQAHENQFGYRPDPATVLKLAADPNLPDTHLPNLFAPQTPASQALAAHPIVTDKQFVQQMRTAAKGAGWDGWLQQNGDRVEELASGKAWQDQVHGIVLQRSVHDGMIARAKASGESDEQAQLSAAHEMKANTMGLSDLGLIARPAGQIINALVHSPGGAYMLGSALVSDAVQQLTHPLTVQHNPKTLPLVKAAGKGFAQDFEHPKENAGYLFLDLLGLASLGGGVAARVGEVGRTGKAGALLRKPPLQRATVNLGGYTEEMPLSSNPFVAAVQKRVLGAREKAANDRLVNGPSPLRSVLMPGWAEEHLSFERKVGREADARQRVEHIAQMSLSHQLDAAAGTALAQSRVLGKLPVTVKHGLTRGEQKAIQVLSWDDPNPLEAERDFHERMVALGKETEDPKFVQAHEEQLANLKLAEKVLANPRPRFKQALDLTRQVIAEQQNARIRELGLSPEQAEGRIVKAADVLRGESTKDAKLGKGQIPDREPGKVEYDGFYLPTQPRGKIKRPPSQVRGKFDVSSGPYGIPLGRDLPELTHTFEGDALRAGDIRIDATNLATEAAARTFRAATVKNQWNKLWQSASPTKRSEWDIPIRDANSIPDELRAVVAKLDEGNFTQEEAAVLPKDMQDLIRSLYPEGTDPKALKTLETEIEGVRWVDSRVLGDVEGAPSRSAKTAARFFQAINAPFRFTALYLRPAYALNKLGNAAMLVFDQGFLNTGVNIARAMHIEKSDGLKNASTIRALVGAGKSRSYVTSQSGAVSRAVGEFWNRFADRDERVASWTYYADRMGYKTPEQRDALLNDPANKADLVEVTRRANKGLVEFDNLTPFEKNVLRHIIFVYPWVRGSAVWSLRAVMEHPAKTALLAELGKQEIQTDPLLDKAPDWFKRVGYFPIGWNHDGTPKVVNPTSINTFSTMSDFFNIGKGAAAGDKYASVSDLFGPAAKFLTHASLGRDEFGNQYPGSQWAGAAKDVLVGLPQLSHLNSKKSVEPAAFDIRRRQSLEASLNAAIHQTVFSPGWFGGYGSLIGGGLSPRGVSENALAARYWADRDPKVRAQRELALLNLALTRQGEFLKRDVPAGIRQTVKTQARLSQMYGDFAKENGRTATTAEKDKIARDFLKAQGHTADQEKAAVKELRQWDSDVRAVYSFTRATFNEKAAGLFKQGLSPQRVYDVPQEQLYDYGRKFVAWQAEIRAAKKNKATAADLRLLTDEHSKPVGGLPSFAALAWAHQTPQEQQHALARDAGAGWATLTSVEKQLLGKPVDPAVTEGWNEYTRLADEAAKTFPAGQRDLAANQRDYLVKYVDKQLSLKGAFLKDYLFAKEPLFQRVQYMRLVKDSPNKDGWHDLLRRAKYFYDAVKNKQTSAAGARDSWSDYEPQMKSYYQSEFPAFWKELQPVLNANPDFIKGLIR